jgi:hypothetical protein
MQIAGAPSLPLEKHFWIVKGGSGSSNSAGYHHTQKGNCLFGLTFFKFAFLTIISFQLVLEHILEQLPLLVS